MASFVVFDDTCNEHVVVHGNRSELERYWGPWNQLKEVDSGAEGARLAQSYDCGERSLLRDVYEDEHSNDEPSADDTTASAPGCMVVLTLLGGGVLAGLLEAVHVAIQLFA